MISTFIAMSGAVTNRTYRARGTAYGVCLLLWRLLATCVIITQVAAWSTSITNYIRGVVVSKTNFHAQTNHPFPNDSCPLTTKSSVRFFYPAVLAIKRSCLVYYQDLRTSVCSCPFLNPDSSGIHGAHRGRRNGRCPSHDSLEILGTEALTVQLRKL